MFWKLGLLGILALVVIIALPVLDAVGDAVAGDARTPGAQGVAALLPIAILAVFLSAMGYVAWRR